MTLIIGSEGSMGRRYKTILNYMNESYDSFDPSLNVGFGPSDFSSYERFIVASPTPTHKAWIRRLDEYEKPILCEKPLSSDLEEVELILNSKSPISMMMQYAFYDRAEYQSEGDSWYRFYNHGKDGLIWDCFQIIALARSHVYLDEKSPVWDAGLNGLKLDLNLMDRAYVWAVKDWFGGKNIPREKLFTMHEKVRDFEVKWNSKQSLL